MATQITGGCLCGAVRYECSADPIFAANCYCRDCQHSSGTAMASVMLVPKPAFKLTKGQLKHYEVTGESGGRVSRGFCGDCGSPIISLISASSEMLAIKAGSLDDTKLFNPMVNVYMASAPGWAPVLPHLPKFDKQPG